MRITCENADVLSFGFERFGRIWPNSLQLRGTVVTGVAGARLGAPMLSTRQRSSPMTRSRIFAPLLVLTSFVSLAAAPIPEPATDVETQFGSEIYSDLRDKGEIIASSPLYDSLNPVAEKISRVAQAYYNHPFKFILVHEPQPNAFSVPGGNVYVVDSLLTFANNTEELAGTLCHEVAHTIHHDSMNRIEEMEKTRIRELGAAILLGPTLAHAIAISIVADLHSLGYSRDAESKADVTGSDICAAAGFNPWGLVWLFRDFQNAEPNEVPQLLSDHPANGTRIKTLEQHFRADPRVFAKFNPDSRSGTPFKVPKDAPEQFLPPMPAQGR
jgi:beta-barrel assembly-enhancing protease